MKCAVTAIVVATMGSLSRDVHGRDREEVAGLDVETGRVDAVGRPDGSGEVG